jgi:hypothetical protein
MTVKNIPAKVRINNIDTIVELNDTETLTNKTLTLPVINGIRESFTIDSSSAIGATPTLDVSNSTAFLYTIATTGTWTPNFTSVNTLLAVGQSITVSVVVNVANTSHFASTIQIDSVAVGTPVGFTLNWQGGVAPAAGSGSASAYDAYTYTIIKTASATYTVFASKTKFDN